MGIQLPFSREAAAIAAGDARVSRSLLATKRVGDLILKNEEEELAAARQLADELLKREYYAPARPVACLQQRQACVDCYQAHAGDPLKCAAQVQAYSQCAQAAFAALSRAKS